MNTIEQCLELERKENKPYLTPVQQALIIKFIEFSLLWSDELSASEKRALTQLRKMNLVEWWPGNMYDQSHWDLSDIGYALFHPKGKLY